jgi:ParB-like chromosome segregation protein Spo0J
MNARLTAFVPLRLARSRGQLVDTAQRKPAPPLLKAIGLALYWQQLLDNGSFSSMEDLAQREGLDLSTVSRVLHLGLIAPDLVETCLAGQQPRTLTLKWLQRNRLPNDWAAQQKIFDSFQ